MEWKTVTLSNGWKGPVTNGMYSKILSTNRNQEDRRLAFEALYEAYQKIRIPTEPFIVLYYRGELPAVEPETIPQLWKKHWKEKYSQRSFPISPKLGSKNTAPLQRYIKLRKKVLGLQEYHYYDNSISLLEYDKEFPYEEAKQLVIDSVLPLGKDYQEN